MRLFSKHIKVKKRDIPAGLWMKCKSCGELVTRGEVVSNLETCPKCGYLYPLPAWQRIRTLFGEGEFFEIDAAMRPRDPLKFVDTVPYPKRQVIAEKKAGIPEAVVTGIGSLGGFAVALAAMDFTYMGGSMGSVVGEKITRLIELALEKRIPLIIISASGGARMQEGALSLMQLAKTSAALARFDAGHLLYISVMTNPTTGGTTASFASLGDITIAEPGALIGFAGPRVIKQTIQQDLPRGFQTSEFLFTHGMIELIAGRRELKGTLMRILSLFNAPKFTSGMVPPPGPRRGDSHAVTNPSSPDAAP
ncbi:MAG: acetyl-CoA carboxylase, carboxyltransferase subunit beta [Candidatus Aureabacteria bacterium]|nr:acetyl-CoA carboxylase, carboxyltransferase subunit beta [Candidatus Auribacterota bacterium]